MRVSDVEQSGDVDGSGENGGVLTNLPRARPQRASARRAAARNGASGNGARKRRAEATPPKRARSTAAKAPAKPRAAAKRRRPAAPVEEPAPRQGYECDGEAPSGPVQPPGGIELVASAAEIVGELAKAGVSTGERVLKDVLSRLPL